MTDRQTDRQTDKQTNRQTDRQTDKQTNRQTDKQTNRQTDRKADTGDRPFDAEDSDGNAQPTAQGSDQLLHVRCSVAAHSERGGWA